MPGRTVTTYEWDAFYRLRKVKNRSTSALVAEHTYNGLGFMLGTHIDTDSDGDVDASDKWFYGAYDEGWRLVANFRETDTGPKEEWVPQQAGTGGRGGSSYINGVVCRYKDANTAWTSASDGTLEQRYYYLQNWRGDVVGLVTSGSYQVEEVRYSAYGVPFGLPGGDADSDGDCDTGDVTQIQTWIDAVAYDVRGDVDLDGDVDATDKSTVQTGYQGASLGRMVLSGAGNRAAYAGNAQIGSARTGHARHRTLGTELGRWLRRDPKGYSDSSNLLEYSLGAPIHLIDPMGLAVCKRGVMWKADVQDTSGQSSSGFGMGLVGAVMNGTPTKGNNHDIVGTSTCVDKDKCPPLDMQGLLKVLFEGDGVKGKEDPNYDKWHEPEAGQSGGSTWGSDQPDTFNAELGTLNKARAHFIRQDRK